MHGLLHDVVANQLELMKSVEDKQKGDDAIAYY